jgi:hypothetical protein
MYMLLQRKSMKENYYKMEEAHEICPSKDIKAILGDLNAKIGREKIYRGLTGTHLLNTSQKC